jgi:DNA-binding LytR/AlgR family response regulator
MPHPPCALIAEDEPLLAAALQAELAKAWPELRVLACVGDGVSAVRLALQHQPEVLFFDIHMPGLNGLDAAAELADAWDYSSPNATPFPALVFVTAYEHYAVQAFEAQAVDYLLKPVQSERLQKTVTKLQASLTNRNQTALALESTLSQLRGLMGWGAAQISTTLTVIQASVGNHIHLVPAAEVVYFESADKYVRVLTNEREYLIRTPLRELVPQLDASSFWQIHRGTVVNIRQVDHVVRYENGKLGLSLRRRSEKLSVSRLYAHLFKAM